MPEFCPSVLMATTCTFLTAWKVGKKAKADKSYKEYKVSQALFQGKSPKTMADLNVLMNKSRIHYGSIEDIERQNRMKWDQQRGKDDRGTSLDDLDFEGDGSDAKAHPEHQAILDEFERKKIARNLAVPTDDGRVRQRLRELGEPQCLFGEGPAERRDRLRYLLSLRVQEAGGDVESEEDEEEDSEEEEDEETEEFFTYGSDELLEARQNITRFSLPRAKKRLMDQRSELEIPAPHRKRMLHEWYTNVQTFATFSSQFGDERPLTYCTFAPNSRLLATGSWSGAVKLWNIPNCNHVHTLRGHKDRISGIAFHPESTKSLSPSAVNLASGATDGSVYLWSFTSDLPVAALTGHTMRVARVAFHPSGRYLGTSSFDTSWRLWDVETATELLLQEGHSRELIDFRLACSGMDSIGRVWDLRSGRSALVLHGHVKPILTLDWSPNGYQIATGSEDNTIRIWDIRKPKPNSSNTNAAAGWVGDGASYVIPAHTNLVSQVKFFKASDDFRFTDGGTAEDVSQGEWTFPGVEKGKNQNGDTVMGDGVDAATSNGDHSMSDAAKGDADGVETPFQRRQVFNGSCLVSSSYDGTCKVWTDSDWKPIKALSGLEGKVMCCDISSDGRFISTASYDRTFKLYASENIRL
ncbi:hypothetical protein HK102_009643 [Quaeritorhiza haematococci]|nr:hypothetical protein HK102_009643 [Quaeritorhiza haematococci]